MPLISVIIPVYKCEKYILKCLESVINQTFTDIEIICINDKSPDNSFDIVREYAKKDDRIVLVENEENKGAGFTRNVGLDIARGEYISFVDSDDYIDSRFLKELYSTSKKYYVDIVSTLNTHQDSDGKFSYWNFHYKSNEEAWKNKYKEFFEEGIAHANSLLSNTNLDVEYQHVVVWNKLWKKEFLDRKNIRFINVNGPEDIAFYYSALAHEPKCAYNHRAKYYYVINNNSSLISQSKNNNRYLVDAIKVTDYLINYYSKNNIRHLNSGISAGINNIIYNFGVYKGKEEFYAILYEYFKNLDLKENNFLENSKYVYKQYNLIKTFPAYDQYLFASDILNQLDGIYSNLYTAVGDNKYSDNWVKLFGVYNTKDRLKIVLFGINIVIKIDADKINRLAWFIPIRKWRDSFRKKFE